MAAPDRDLLIRYNRYEIGGTSGRQIHSKWRHRVGYEEETVEFDFVISGASEAEFTDNCQEAEQVFRTPRGQLEINQKGFALVSANPGDNSAFTADPAIEKVGDDIDGPRTRLYSVSITFQKPADLVGQSGLQNASIDVKFRASRRRTVTLTGVYTALEANRAREQYNSAIATYVSGRLALIGGVYELTEETAEEDDDRRKLNFTRVYKEIILPQTSLTVDDPEIIDQSISIKRGITTPGDAQSAGDVERLRDVVVTAQMEIDTNNTSLGNKYTSTIKPYLISLAFSTYEFSTGALVDETVDLNATDNTISVNMTFRMVGQSNIVEFARTIEELDDPAFDIIKVWDGSPHSKILAPGLAVKNRNITDNILIIGQDESILADLKNTPVLDLTSTKVGRARRGSTRLYLTKGESVVSGDASGWVTLRQRVTEAVTKIGQSDRFIFGTNRTIETLQMWVDKPSVAAVAGAPRQAPRSFLRG